MGSSLHKSILSSKFNDRSNLKPSMEGDGGNTSNDKCNDQNESENPIKINPYKNHLADVLDVEEHKDSQKGCNISPYLLAIAMAIHACFAGLALGLQSEFSGFLGMFLAIVAHKWAESMTIGISFAKNLKLIGMKQAII